MSVASQHSRAGATPAAGLSGRLWRDLGEDDASLAHLVLPERPVPLGARTDVADLALAGVAVAGLAAAVTAGATPAAPDPDRIAVAFSSERYIRIDGQLPDAWAPLSGFWPTADGWVRTHGNYPHHAAILCAALGLPEQADAPTLGAVLAVTATVDACRRVENAGGLCVPVLTEDEHLDASLRERPVIETKRLGAAPPRETQPAPIDAPLGGIRILDLTRVIAGPVATRTLALLGADVLRLDPVNLPEKQWQHLDTGHAKRSALLSAITPRGRARLHSLIDDADVVVTGYRPKAAARLGLDPDHVADHHPGIVVARLAAWGFDTADLDRRGFDSLVQAASGISWIESGDGTHPGALPAQALDHTAGYLLAAAVMTLLRRRADEGGSWLAQVSLRRVAAELLGMPRTAQPQPAADLDPAPHLQTFELDGLTLTTAAPAITYDGAPTLFDAPRPWGRDEPAWHVT